MNGLPQREAHGRVCQQAISRSSHLREAPFGRLASDSRRALVLREEALTVGEDGRIVPIHRRPRDRSAAYMIVLFVFVILQVLCVVLAFRD